MIRSISWTCKNKFRKYMNENFIHKLVLCGHYSTKYTPWWCNFNVSVCLCRTVFGYVHRLTHIIVYRTRSKAYGTIISLLVCNLVFFLGGTFTQLIDYREIAPSSVLLEITSIKSTLEFCNASGSSNAIHCCAESNFYYIECRITKYRTLNFYGHFSFRIIPGDRL